MIRALTFYFYFILIHPLYRFLEKDLSDRLAAFLTQSYGFGNRAKGTTLQCLNLKCFIGAILECREGLQADELINQNHENKMRNQEYSYSLLNLLWLVIQPLRQRNHHWYLIYPSLGIAKFFFTDDLLSTAYPNLYESAP